MSSGTAVGTHSGAGPLSLMSCVRESSPLQDYEQEIEKNVASKRRFWNPKKWFKRKHKQSEEVVVQDISEIGKDVLRSRSTSELSVDEDQPRRSSTSMHPGLSVSHDSVFHPLNSGSDLELEATQSSSSLSISQPLVDAKLQTELSERLRLRRSRGTGGGDCTSEDDEGLPRSPCCNSPTTADGFLLLDKTAIKDLPTKSHSTCSDGSLLSMDGSEMDEDSFGFNSRHSSKLSLQEKRTEQDSDLELGVTQTTTPLNHSAAHHRVSVRPKRTYGAPRRKKGQQLSSALPATPEVNEESSTRSISPASVTQESLTELYSVSTTTVTLTDNKLKCSSLPPGTAPPTADDIARLNRSKSNAGNKSRDIATLHEEEKEEKLSIFERIFPRRSGKKKKKDEHKVADITDAVTSVKATHATASNITTKSYKETTHLTPRREEVKPQAPPRTGPASRQRIQPIDIPSTPTESRLPIYSPEKLTPPSRIQQNSPIHAELENVFKQRQSSIPSSPVERVMHSPPLSPKSLDHTVILRRELMKTTHSEAKREETLSKVKITGLSSLQQRVLTLNNDENDGFKSLTEFPLKPNKPITKSHSFKSSNAPVEENAKEEKESVIKASSLDSVKNLEDEVKLTSHNHLEQTSETKVYSSYLKHEKFELKKDNNISLSPISPISQENESKVDSWEFKGVTTNVLRSSVTTRNDKPMISHFKEEQTEQKLITMSSKSSPVTEKQDENDKIPKSFNEAITISGPSHTAVVNVGGDNFITTENENKTVIKENQLSVTKIQFKHESTNVTKSSVTIPKSEVPEFLNKQLNRVDARPTSTNIIFSMKPKVSDENQTRPTTLFNFDVTKPPMPRKFSKENVEIIEKENASPKTPPFFKESPIKTPTIEESSDFIPKNRFKKNEVKSSSRKSSVISITPESPIREKPPLLKHRSMSLDSLKSEQNDSVDISSQDSLDQQSKNSTEEVVLRRKSLTKKKNDEEPELMKVFARRSLKLKDNQVEEIQEALIDMKARDSDKENNDSIEDDCVKEEIEVKATKELEENLKELKNKENEEPEVQIRRPLNSNFFIKTQRSISMTPSGNNNNNKVINNDVSIKKQSSLSERRKTDQWIKKEEKTEQWIVKKEESIKERVSEEILNLAPKNEEVKTETKNFSQRKAEWEKRAQLAQKKTVP